MTATFDQLNLFRNSLKVSSRLFSEAAGDAAILTALHEAATTTIDCLQQGGTLFTCGNGGSAAQATHFSAELVGPFANRDRPAYRAIPLGFDPSALTAIANDYDYSVALARQLRGLAKSGDVLWALSTSGNSGNVVAALEAAAELGVKSVLLTNHDGGKGKPLADIVLHTPKCATARVQELHLIYGHTLCGVVEAAMVAGADQTTRAAA